MSNADAVNKAAVAAAGELHRLDPGPLADLRRMQAETAAPAFWRLAARYPDTVGARQEVWITILRILAILTPKGAAEGRPALHDFSRPFGAALWRRSGMVRSAADPQRTQAGSTVGGAGQGAQRADDPRRPCAGHQQAAASRP